MPDQTRQCVGLWLLLTSLVMLASCATSEENFRSLYEKAEYHAMKLEETLNEFTDSAEPPQASNMQCGRLVRSVQQMCPVDGFTGDRGTSRSSKGNQRKSTTVMDSKKFSSSFSSTFTDVVLAKVTAKRLGENVEVEFFVNHSSPALIQRYGSFDSQKKFLNSSVVEGKFQMSKASFIIDTAVCAIDDNNYIMEKFAIELVENKFSYVNLDLEKCGLYKSTKTHPSISQVLKTPSINILTPPDNVVVIEKGKNVLIEAEMILNTRNEARVFVNLWDWELNKFVHDWKELETKGNRLDIDKAKSSDVENLISIDVLDEVVIDDDDDDNTRLYVKIRITVNVASGDRSGSLYISSSYERRGILDESRDIIDTISNGRTVEMKFPFKISAYPLNALKMDQKDSTVQCDEDGNRNGEKFGKNCTIQCGAYGSNIKSIFILKSQPYRPPVRSSSAIIDNLFAEVIHDLGPASKDNAGAYKCVVLLRNGEIKTKTIRLVTSKFTKVSNFTLEDASDSTTSLLTCFASGSGKLDMSISGDISPDYVKERLDDKQGTFRSVTSLENDVTKLTLLIPKEHLKYPVDEVFCSASGEGGSDQMSIRPSDFSEEFFFPMPDY